MLSTPLLAVSAIDNGCGRRRRHRRRLFRCCFVCLLNGPGQRHIIGQPCTATTTRLSMLEDKCKHNESSTVYTVSTLTGAWDCRWWPAMEIMVRRYQITRAGHSPTISGRVQEAQRGGTPPNTAPQISHPILQHNLVPCLQRASQKGEGVRRLTSAPEKALPGICAEKEGKMVRSSASPRGRPISALIFCCSWPACTLARFWRCLSASDSRSDSSGCA